MLELIVDGQAFCVDDGLTVAAALSVVSDGTTRTDLQGSRRAPFCGMGICQECKVLINGRRRLACQTRCESGMTIRTTP